MKTLILKARQPHNKDICVLEFGLKHLIIKPMFDDEHKNKFMLSYEQIQRMRQ